MFELDETIINQLVFAMENKKSESYIDLLTGKILDAGEAAKLEDQVLEPVPEWSSADGFKLMERFAKTINDAEIRLALRTALAKGKGVFKNFKRILDSYPDTDLLWHEFKLIIMGQKIHQWYDELRERLGLEGLGHEPEDLEQLIKQDYEIRICKEEDAAAEKLIGICKEDLLQSRNPALVEHAFTAFRLGIENAKKDNIFWYRLETAGGQLAALAVVERISTANSSAGFISMLCVEQGYRREGLGMQLVNSIREDLEKQDIFALMINLPYLPAGFERALVNSGYTPWGSRWQSPEA